MVAWDRKDDPRPHIRALFRTFRLRPSLKELDPASPENLLGTIATRHRLHLYDVPSLEGSDVYGFVLSREVLAKREIQQIEADYWVRTLTASIARGVLAGDRQVFEPEIALAQAPEGV